MKTYLTAVQLILLAGVCGWVMARDLKKLKIHYLADECDKFVEIGHMARVMLSKLPYLSYMNCSASFRPRKSTTSTQLMIHFRDINIIKSEQCRLDKLQLYDGSSTNDPTLTKHAICSADEIGGLFTTTDTVTLYFVNAGLKGKSHPSSIPSFEKDISGFDMIITAFHTGPCSNAFGCKNGRCISQQLECNGYNNCGDNSDEAKCGLSTMGWTALGLAGTMGVVLIVSVTALWVRRHSRRGTYTTIN